MHKKVYPREAILSHQVIRARRDGSVIVELNFSLERQIYICNIYLYILEYTLLM